MFFRCVQLDFFNRICFQRNCFVILFIIFQFSADIETNAAEIFKCQEISRYQLKEGKIITKRAFGEQWYSLDNNGLHYDWHTRTYTEKWLEKNESNPNTGVFITEGKTTYLVGNHMTSVVNHWSQGQIIVIQKCYR